jgi:hypothetical protein
VAGKDVRHRNVSGVQQYMKVAGGIVEGAIPAWRWVGPADVGPVIDGHPAGASKFTLDMDPFQGVGAEGGDDDDCW